MTSPHLKKNGVHEMQVTREAAGSQDWHRGSGRGRAPPPELAPPPPLNSARSAPPPPSTPLAPPRPQADFGGRIPAPAPKAVRWRVTCVSDDDVLEEISVSHGPEVSVFRVLPIATATHLRPL